MSYKVLARKWRPQHFRDIIGQEPVVQALSNALDTDRLHHAYLFTGMRGVGKTTIARILAKCLNCETRGVSSDPCGQCSTCQDIEAGRFFDLIEVDAASRTKVEGTRELLENVPYAPASGRYKVYLIDEVHMFSTHSFNALLKTLEEPPEHVKFVLATTDPQKVPATVLSRCLQFNLKRMSAGLLVEYLSGLLGEEGIKFEIPALDLIARAADGSVRDALSLVEQAAAFGNASVAAAEVENMLGRASVDRLLSLIETLAEADMQKLFAQVEALAQYAPDYTELMGEILSLLHRIALLQSVENSVPESVPGFERLVQLAKSIDAETLQLLYQIGLHARRDMPFAPDPREAFDMALLRMNAFKPDPGVANGHPEAQLASDAEAEAPPAVQSHSRVAGVLPVKGEVSAGGAMRAAALAAARGEPAPTVSGQATGQSVDQTKLSDSHKSDATEYAVNGNTTAVNAEDVTAPDMTAREHSGQPGAEEHASASSVSEQPPAVAEQMESARTVGLKAADGAASNSKSIEPGDWPRVVTELDIAGMPLQLASHCELIEVSAQTVTLRMQQNSEHLNTPRFVERVQAALSSWLGRDIKLKMELVELSLTTPASLSEQKKADDLAAAHASINDDPIVKQLIDRVDGAVDESSVRPVGNS